MFEHGSCGIVFLLQPILRSQEQSHIALDLFDGIRLEDCGIIVGIGGIGLYGCVFAAEDKHKVLLGLSFIRAIRGFARNLS